MTRIAESRLKICSSRLATPRPPLWSHVCNRKMQKNQSIDKIVQAVMFFRSPHDWAYESPVVPDVDRTDVKLPRGRFAPWGFHFFNHSAITISGKSNHMAFSLAPPAGAFVSQRPGRTRLPRFWPGRSRCRHAWFEQKKSYLFSPARSIVCS